MGLGVFSLLAMKPVETGKIPGTGIYAIRNGISNVYAFDTGDGYALLDAGVDAAKLTTALNSLSIGVASVRFIFLTHTDRDHVAALKLFPDACVYMSEDEARMLDRTVKRQLFGYNSLPQGINPILLTDNQELSFAGCSVRCIKMPGHTPGSMSYLLDGKYLFTGDAVRFRDGGCAIHPFTMDKSTAGASLARIGELGKSSELVLTSHYGYRQRS